MTPLAQRLRPSSFAEVVGLPAALADGAALRLSVADGRLPSMILWGPPGCGKTTIAKNLEQKLHAEGFLTQVLDGDNTRTGINNNLGFSLEDRTENIRRVAEVSNY